MIIKGFIQSFDDVNSTFIVNNQSFYFPPVIYNYSLWDDIVRCCKNNIEVEIKYFDIVLGEQKAINIVRIMEL